MADLLHTLPAALLACVLPGYFWAAVLCGPRDLIERLAYSTALSVALVPTAALLQTSLLGGGVTLGVAAVSALAVFASGLAAWLMFGAATESENPPVSLRIPPPNTPALLLLMLALGIALVSTIGGEPSNTYVLATAALIAFAAATSALGARRDSPPEPEEAGTSWVGAIAFWAAAFATFSLTAFRGYVGVVSHDWPFLRGGDQYNHAVMANSMLSEGGYFDSYLAYPPGFGTLTATASRLGGVEPLDVFPTLAPSLVLLPALACYALGRMLGGKWCALAAAFFAGTMLSGTYANILDARYPNLISAQFLLVLTVAALIRLYHTPTARPALLASILGSAIVLYHPVASLYLAMLLAPISVLFLPYLLIARRRREALALFSSLALLGILSIFYAWDTYDLPTFLIGLLGDSDTGAGGAGVSAAIGTQPPLGLRHLIETISQPVLWLGLFGALLFVFEWRGRPGAPQILARATILIWAVLLFAGSRTALSGFPQRFERDLGIPLAILAALVLVAISSSLRIRSLPAKSVAVAAVALIAAASAIQTERNLRAAAEPAPTITQEAAEAGEWLGDNNDGGSIISTPFLAPNVPNRAILALGGYTELQSYTEKRVRTPRSLPPSGRETIEASFWVINHPDGQRTRRILERYDVRHLIFAKGYTGANWQGFEERENLYRKEFENDSVVIFAPR